MKVLIFGATGMVGGGVLRECLLAADVDHVQTVGRTPTSVVDAKLSELVHPDLFDYSKVESSLQGYDACFFCLGVSAAGMTESKYSRLTYDGTLAAAATLSRLNPAMTFVYVSGAGTDSSEHGRIMWARVKGRAENALLRLPFKAVFLFRPGVIQPMHGARSKTRSYQFFYTLSSPILPLLHKLFPNSVLTTEGVGRAMLALARTGASKAVMEVRDIAVLARGGTV